jgi:hypothetical protein
MASWLLTSPRNSKGSLVVGLQIGLLVGPLFDLAASPRLLLFSVGFRLVLVMDYLLIVLGSSPFSTLSASVYS